MFILFPFLPLVLFILLYVGSGIYFSLQGVSNAFYQVSPLVAILPAIGLGWFMHKGHTEERMKALLDGVRHKDIITMCIIFLLAGAFSVVTKSIGSIDSTVNMALDIIPPHFLLVGLFVTAAFISTAIGTSMGTIATLAPIAAGLAGQGAFPATLGMATIVGGAMFGDNLSIISDTTIAAVMSQEANLKKKLKINVQIAVPSSILTVAVLFLVHDSSFEIATKPYDWYLILPYIFLVTLAVMGFNVFVILVSSLVFAFTLGFITQPYTVLAFAKDITNGFNSMYEIMVLSLMVGGLSGLMGHASKDLAVKLSEMISKRGNQRLAQLIIAKIVAVFDLLLANNTVAIIFSGEIARDIAKRYNIPRHYSAAWLDIFSCVIQGIIPYGAQILLASSIAGISPLSIVPHVYYCYVLGVVSLLYILFNKRLKS
jgi:Na+/H+ antiporter NhaC